MYPSSGSHVVARNPSSAIHSLGLALTNCRQARVSESERKDNDKSLRERTHLFHRFLEQFHLAIANVDAKFAENGNNGLRTAIRINDPRGGKRTIRVRRNLIRCCQSYSRGVETKVFNKPRHGTIAVGVFFGVGDTKFGRQCRMALCWVQSNGVRHQRRKRAQYEHRITSYLRRTRINKRPSSHLDDAFPIMNAKPIIKELKLRNIVRGSKPTI